MAAVTSYEKTLRELFTLGVVMVCQDNKSNAIIVFVADLSLMEALLTPQATSRVPNSKKTVYPSVSANLVLGTRLGFSSIATMSSPSPPYFHVSWSTTPAQEAGYN